MSTKKPRNYTKNIISKILGENPELTATEVYTKYCEKVPNPEEQRGLNAIQKIVAELKGTDDESIKIGINNPWTIGSLSKNELNPAVIPILLKMQSIILNADTPFSINNGRPITNQQAIWASRLYSTLAELLKDNPQAISESLVYWAGEYTIQEKIAKYQGKTHFETAKLDQLLLTQPDKSINSWIENRIENNESDQGVLFVNDLSNAFYPPPHIDLDTDCVSYPSVEDIFLTPDIDLIQRDKRCRKLDQPNKNKKDGE